MGELIKVNFKTGQVLEVKSETEAPRVPLADQYDTQENRNIFEHFDYMVQCIISRFGDNQPATGPVCDRILTGPSKRTLEAYGYGCVHNSEHFHKTKTRLSEKGQWNRPSPFPTDLRDADKILQANKGKTLRFGGESDPFQWLDMRYRNAHSILKRANKHGVKLKIYTQSDLVAHDEYIDLIAVGGHEVVFHMGVDGFTDHEERVLSPGAPSLGRRRKAIDLLIGRGVKVSTRFVSIEDFIKTYPRRAFNALGWGHKLTVEQVKEAVAFRARNDKYFAR